MSMTAENILDTLRTMPRTEVDEVKKRITAFMQFGEWGGDVAEDDNSSEAKRVFHIIATEMQAAGLADARALSYWRLPNRRSFVAKAERLVDFLNKQHQDRRVQDGILRIGVQLLIKHFQKYAEETDAFVLTTDMVARNVNKVPARLDREFPGYGAVGVLHLLIPHP